EMDDLATALRYVNAIRARAAKLPAKLAADGTPAANYVVKPYPNFPSKDYARQAVRFERRLELAMEGHRYFDLVRWGVAKTVIESYSNFEGGFIPKFKNITFKPHNEYFPIPQSQIDRSSGALVQNEGY